MTEASVVTNTLCRAVLSTSSQYRWTYHNIVCGKRYVYPCAYPSCSLPYLGTSCLGRLISKYVQMSGQERLKDRLKNKFNHLLHSLVPDRSRSPSPNRPIRPTQNPQTSSTPVGPDPNSIHGNPDTQPLNPPSLSNIYPSIVIDSTGDEAPGRMADLASTGFQGVKTTLRLVERASDVFLPLKSTIAGLLGVIDIVEVRDFQLNFVIIMVLIVPRQRLRTNKIAMFWSRN